MGTSGMSSCPASTRSCSSFAKMVLMRSGPAFQKISDSGEPVTCGEHMMRWPATASGELTMAKKARSEEHTSELQSLMRISYAVFCLKKKNNKKYNKYHQQ